MIKNRQYVKFCLYGFLKNLRFFDAFFILFLLQRGLDYTHIGILYALREIFTNVFEIPSGIIADSYGRKSALLASFVAYIVSFMLFYQAQNFIW
ncbi:MAG TPA: MFS transporter, partial [Oceanospirillales bacterium]|nr:MFS transporter [Oceanospirillales bacterium]